MTRKLWFLFALLAALTFCQSAEAQPTPTWKNDAQGRPAPPCMLLDPVTGVSTPCSSSNPIPTSGAGSGLGTTSGTSTTGFGKQWFPGTVTGAVANGEQMRALFDSNLGTDTLSVIFLRRSTTCANCLQVAFSGDGGITATPFVSTGLTIANSLQVAKRFQSSPPRYLVSADNGATAVIATSLSPTSGWALSTGLAVGDSLSDADGNANGSTVIAAINENNLACRSTNGGQAFTCAAVAGKGNGGSVVYAGGTTWLIFEGAAGNVWRSTNDGVTFALQTSFGSAAQGGPRCLSPSFTTCILRTADANVRLSTDGGATWPTSPLNTGGIVGFGMCEAQANSPAGTGVFAILSSTPPIGLGTVSQNAFSSFNAGVAWFTGQTNGSHWDGTGTPSVNAVDCRNGKGIATYSTTGGGVNVFSVYNPLTQPGGVLQSSAGGYSIAAPIQAGVILNVAPTVSAANAAAAVTKTGVTGTRICIRRIAVFPTGGAGTFTLNVTDGGTVVLNLGTITALAAGAVREFEGTPLLCGQTSATLVVNIGAAGVGITTTTSVIADRYPN